MGGNFRVAAFFVEKYLEINLMLYLCEQKKHDTMTTAALQNVWQTILGYDLSASNKRWLADQLNALADKEEENLRPYTMEEIDERINMAEEQVASGQLIDSEDIACELKEYVGSHRSKIS